MYDEDGMEYRGLHELSKEEEAHLLKWAGIDDDDNDGDQDDDVAPVHTAHAKSHAGIRVRDMAVPAGMVEHPKTSRHWIKAHLVVKLRNGWNLRRTHKRVTSTSSVRDRERWYLRHGLKVISGPYPSKRIAKAAFLGSDGTKRRRRSSTIRS